MAISPDFPMQGCSQQEGDDDEKKNIYSARIGSGRKNRIEVSDKKPWICVVCGHKAKIGPFCKHHWAIFVRNILHSQKENP